MVRFRSALLILCLKPLSAQVDAGLIPQPVYSRSAPATQSPQVFIVPPPDLTRGSTPSGTPSPHTLALTMADTVQRALRYNLGLATSGESTRVAQSLRLSLLSQLLPSLNGRVSETIQQVNLQAFGFRGGPVFGESFSPVIGPFSVFDARAYLTQTIFDATSIAALHSGTENLRAVEFRMRDLRAIVAQLASTLYLQAIAASSQIESTLGQVRTAETLYQQAQNQRQAGVVPRIDVLRAQVELQTRQQQLIATRNDFEQQKLTLARVIGLPPGQRFDLVDEVPFTPPPVMTVDEALGTAYETRSDLRAAVAAERSAQYDLQAASAQKLPALSFSANYGTIGPAPGWSHGTFATTFSLDFPIYQGGRIRASEQRARAVLQQRRSETAGLRGQIDNDVRIGFLNLRSASEQVEVARSTVLLAGEALQHAQNRFQAGVTNNLEVVQAQESVAKANQGLIAGLYIYNQAKASLARAMGYEPVEMLRFLGAKTK